MLPSWEISGKRSANQWDFQPCRTNRNGIFSYIPIINAFKLVTLDLSLGALLNITLIMRKYKSSIRIHKHKSCIHTISKSSNVVIITCTTNNLLAKTLYPQRCIHKIIQLIYKHVVTHVELVLKGEKNNVAKTSVRFLTIIVSYSVQK